MPLRELTPAQIAALERLLAQGFSPVVLPLYPNFIALRRDPYAVLLAPIEGGGLCFYGEPCYLIDGQLAVYVRRRGRDWFVWKGREVEATPELLAARRQFLDDVGAGS